MVLGLFLFGWFFLKSQCEFTDLPKLSSPLPNALLRPHSCTIAGAWDRAWTDSAVPGRLRAGHLHPGGFVQLGKGGAGHVSPQGRDAGEALTSIRQAPGLFLFVELMTSA